MTTCGVNLFPGVLRGVEMGVVFPADFDFGVDFFGAGGFAGFDAGVDVVRFNILLPNASAGDGLGVVGYGGRGG